MLHCFQKGVKPPYSEGFFRIWWIEWVNGLRAYNAKYGSIWMRCQCIRSITLFWGNAHIYENNLLNTERLLAGEEVKFELNVWWWYTLLKRPSKRIQLTFESLFCEYDVCYFTVTFRFCSFLASFSRIWFCISSRLVLPIINFKDCLLFFFYKYLKSCWPFFFLSIRTHFLGHYQNFFANHDG